MLAGRMAETQNPLFAHFGGKSAGLLKMKEAGFRIPETLHFETERAASWLKTIPGYDEALEDWAFWKNLQAPPTLKAFRDEILRSEMPGRWLEHFETAERRLGSNLIVRSDMNLEDGSDLSFAGAFQSLECAPCLSTQEVWEAAKKVIASAFEPSAALQVLSAGIHPRELKPSFLIQKLVPSKIAGVSFSRNPQAVWEKTSVAEYAEGKGSGIVGGTRQTTVESLESKALSPLTPFRDELRERVELAEKIIGAPADLEWVWDGTNLFFVQLRPIATEEAKLGDVHWTRALSLERFPEAISTLGWDAIADSMDSNLQSLARDFGILTKEKRPMAVQVRSLIYSDPHFFDFPQRTRIRWSRYLSPFQSHIWLVLFSFLKFFRNLIFSRNRKAAGALFKIEILNAIMGPQASRISSAWSAHVASSMEAILKFKPKWANRKKIEAGEILERMEELKILSLKMLEPDFAIFLIKDRLHHALQDLWKALGKSELGFVESVKVENENRTLQMKQQWSGLMGILNRDPGKEAFLAKLKKGESEPEKPLTESARLAWLGFLVENGHCRTSWDIALPSWGDSPETLAPLIASSLQKPLYPAAPERETPERLLIEAGFSHELNAIKRSLKRLSEFIRIDEELHFLTGHLLQPSRALVLQASEVLRGKGLLKIESDVFFLKLNELKRALAFPDLNLSFLAARRRSGFERACENPGPFEIPPEAAKNIPPRKDAKNIVGQPMSRGQATGKVRFVEHLGEASNMERGSILVTTAPNPSFVPLYSVIGGILTQTGGLLSHGFVAARELGVPAVSGIPSFQLKEGMKVRIDGVTGLVEILSDERGNE